MKEPKTRSGRDDDADYIYITEYRHWRSKKLIRAADYGKKAFRIPRRRRK